MILQYFPKGESERQCQILMGDKMYWSEVSELCLLILVVEVGKRQCRALRSVECWVLVIGLLGGCSRERS